MARRLGLHLHVPPVVFAGASVVMQVIGTNDCTNRAHQDAGPYR